MTIHLFSRAPTALLLLLFFLSACQTLPQKNAQTHNHDALLAAQSKWQAEGKMAVSFQGKRQTVSFQWRQFGDNYAIHLFGPFGQGSTWLRRTSRGVTFENAKLGKQQADTAEALLMDNVGWQLPVSNLSYWIRGLPASKPDPDQQVRDNDDRLSQLIQEGWQVDFVRYQTVKGWSLPEKIRLSHKDTRYGDIKATAVIKQWDLPYAPGARY